MSRRREKDLRLLPALDAKLLAKHGVFSAIASEAASEAAAARKQRHALWRAILAANRERRDQHAVGEGQKDARGGDGGDGGGEARTEWDASVFESFTEWFDGPQGQEEEEEEHGRETLECGCCTSCVAFRKRNEGIARRCKRADIDRLLSRPTLNGDARVPFAPMSCRVVGEEHWSARASMGIDEDGKVGTLPAEDEVRSAVKLVVRLSDGHEVETVVLKHKPPASRSDQAESLDCAVGPEARFAAARGTRNGSDRATVCVSSQIGCKMACSFCATGTLGLKGNLLAGEILEQVALAYRYADVRNVVFMGMGEPFDNYDNVIDAVAALTDNEVFGLSSKHVTISTVRCALSPIPIPIPIPPRTRPTRVGVGLSLPVGFRSRARNVT